MSVQIQISMPFTSYQISKYILSLYVWYIRRIHGSRTIKELEILQIVRSAFSFIWIRTMRIMLYFISKYKAEKTAKYYIIRKIVWYIDKDTFESIKDYARKDQMLFPRDHLESRWWHSIWFQVKFHASLSDSTILQDFEIFSQNFIVLVSQHANSLLSKSFI